MALLRNVLERVLKIIWILISSLRADHVSLYGNRWLETRGFESFGKEGRTFTQANCSSIDPVSTRLELLTGLSAERFLDPLAWSRNCQPARTLPGRLEAMGYRTALLTDHYPMLGLYESMNAFGTVHFVPGQGADPHLSGAFSAKEDFQNPVFNTVISAQSKLPDEQSLDNYIRNRSQYPHLGHPSVRLFNSLNEFLKATQSEDWFVLVDCYGLTPPWDVPHEFSRYRNEEDESKNLLWPMEGPVDPDDDAVSKQLTLLRRGYADSCLFMDNLIAQFTGESATTVILSDHGVLIGDEDFLLGKSNQNYPVLTRQALMVRGGSVEPGSRCDEAIAPVDFYGSTLARIGSEKISAGDGRIIEALYQ